MSVPRNPVSFTAKTHAPPNSNGHGPTRSTRSLRLNFPLFFDFFVPHHAFLVGTHMQTGFAVTPSKQTTVILSSRYKKSPPGGVACWLLTIRRGSGSPASPPRRTRRGATTPTLDPSLATSSVESNRHTPQLEPIVTHSKQTTVVLSNRHKSPPPWRILLCNLPAPLARPRPPTPVSAGPQTSTPSAATRFPLPISTPAFPWVSRSALPALSWHAACNGPDWHVYPNGALLSPCQIFHRARWGTSGMLKGHLGR
jgi:hypothetical protein